MFWYKLALKRLSTTPPLWHFGKPVILSNGGVVKDLISKTKLVGSTILISTVN